MIKYGILCCCVFGALSCANPEVNEKQESSALTEIDSTPGEVMSNDTSLRIEREKTNITYDFDTTEWMDVSHLDAGIILDLKYSTTDNFVNLKLYDCPRCFLRPEVAEALHSVHRHLVEKGFRVKVFDCYRPQSVQRQLWEILPDPNYVANPASGSMHSRGVAVDLTLVDENGIEVDMGTPFDFFGPEAHMDFEGHSTEVLENRELLHSAMRKFGFEGIRTEWWHFSFRGLNYPLDEMIWDCY